MIAFLIILPFLLVYAVFAIWAERKVSAFIHDRLGPMEVGYKGLLQTVADLVKLLQKEEIVPQAAEKRAFWIAPVIIFVAVFAGFATLPLAPGLIGSPIKMGVFYMLAIISLDVIGFIIAGWSSNNKYSIYGAMRAVAQIISYEVPLSLTILSVLMISQSLDLQEIATQQGVFWNDEVAVQAEELIKQGLTSEAQTLLDTKRNYLFGIKAWGIEVTEIGGITTWNIVRFPLLFIGLIIFYISSLAESNRAPFDIPEAESELIAGFQTEYSGFRWSMIMLGEYALMLLVAFLGSTLFLGAWNTPLPNIGTSLPLANWTSGTPGELSGYAWGIFWLFSKAIFWVLTQIWVRFTYPRLRADQLMYLCWKVLIPFATIIVLLAGVWRLLMI